MNLIPCLFTLGSQFGNKVIFGLISSAGVCAVRAIPRPVRQISDPPPKPVPPDFDLLLAGHECEAWLTNANLLEPLFLAMAEDMAAAVASRVTTYTDTPQGRAAAKRRVKARLGLL